MYALNPIDKKPGAGLAKCRQTMPASGATRLLGKILALRTEVGDGLNDEELTHLLRQEVLTVEAGFWFVSLSDGCAIFSVPPQAGEQWHPDGNTMAPEKEAVAAAIAEKCGFSLWEPTDELPPLRPARAGRPAANHHRFEMEYQWETVVTAHLRYLKIRLFDPNTKEPLPLPADLLQQLAALYPA